MEEENIGLIAPYVSSSVTASADGESDDITIYGTTPAYYEIQGMQLAMGRWLKSSDIKNHTYVCIISESTATELIGYADCVGQAIFFNGVEYTIVGVLSDEEKSLTSLVSSGSTVAYLPYTSLIRLSDSLTSDVTTFSVSASGFTASFISRSSPIIFSSICNRPAVSTKTIS